MRERFINRQELIWATTSTSSGATADLAAHEADTTTHGISTFGATLVDDATAAAARTTLGVGATDSPTFTNVTATGITTATLAATEKVDVYTGQAGGWRDITGFAVSPTAGLTIPVWSQMGASPFYGYKYAVNDQQWYFYHINHDYSPGTDIYLHVHWLTDGTSTNKVNWEFTWTFAKGFNQGASSTYDMTGTVVTVEQAGAGTAYRHMTSEIATPASDVDFEVDGILMVRLRRIAASGAANADGVFVTLADCHHQCNTVSTKNRQPNFYT